MMMRYFLITIFCISFFGLAATAFGEDGKSKKTQQVDFTGDTVDGSARTPDAAYISQKKTVDFVPIYKVREHFDVSIKESIDYLK